MLSITFAGLASAGKRRRNCCANSETSTRSSTALIESRRRRPATSWRKGASKSAKSQNGRARLPFAAPGPDRGPADQAGLSPPDRIDGEKRVQIAPAGSYATKQPSRVAPCKASYCRRLRSAERGSRRRSKDLTALQPAFSRCPRAASAKSFERSITTTVYILWLRRFGRWHVLAFEGFSACPARIFLYPRLVARRSFPMVDLSGRSGRVFAGVTHEFLRGRSPSDRSRAP